MGCKKCKKAKKLHDFLSNEADVIKPNNKIRIVWGDSKNYLLRFVQSLMILLVFAVSFPFIIVYMIISMVFGSDGLKIPNFISKRL